MPYTYFPDASGGTEVFVHALASQLGSLGYPSAVAAPATTAAEYVHDGIPVHRFAVDPRARLELAYGFPDEIAAEGFRGIVERLRPRIVHLHARTAAVSERLVDCAHAAGASVVFTYHTPTASCARGTMMLFGRSPCDGRVEEQRCTTCTLAGLGLPRPLAEIATVTSNALARPTEAFGIEGRLPAAMRMPGLIARGRHIFMDFVAKVDHVVAVCRWVAEVLERNGVPASKITLSRQGFAGSSETPGRRRRRDIERLRIAYFGRLDRTKGVDTLGEALAREPGLAVSLDVYAIVQGQRSSDLELLKAQAERDSRLRILPAVSPGEVTRVMAGYDLIAVPSRWLETGPLVVLEAFAAGVPVLGSKLGGIAELVRHGIDGILVNPNDIGEWSDWLDRLASDSRVISGLRNNVAPPRTMDECTADMANIYAGLCAKAA